PRRPRPRQRHGVSFQRRVSYIGHVVALSEKSLTDKVLAGERISPEEALELYRRPLAELGQLANARRD
ncbi:MAG TPA: hypothetical protein VF751_04315, partial [Chthoniobacterales bacterium]